MMNYYRSYKHCLRNKYAAIGNTKEEQNITGQAHTRGYNLRECRTKQKE